jgi:phage-related protein
MKRADKRSPTSGAKQAESDVLSPADRPVHWVGASLDDLREMADEVKDGIGKSLRQAQQGGRAQNTRIMTGFSGASVVEIREDHDTDTYRCIYTVRFAEAVYVLHVFQKKSKQGARTPQSEINRIKTGLKEANEHYKQNYGVQSGGTTTTADAPGENTHGSNRGQR